MRYLMIVFTLIFIQCKDGRERMYTENSGDELALEKAAPASIISADSKDSESTMSSTDLSNQLKILKSGDMQFEVNDLKKSKAEVDALLKSLGGYYQNEQYNASGSSNAFQLSIRIPSGKFEDFISGLDNEHLKLISKSIHADDVSEEYHDLEIRQKNSEAYIEQYKVLLAKAQSIKDMLEIQEKIRILVAELEVYKGRLKYLNDRVSVSSLNIELREYVKFAGTHINFTTRISNALSNGFEGCINVLIGLLQFWLLFLFITGGYFIWRKRTKKLVVN